MIFSSGDVLRVAWDERPLRVLMADPIETFYDVHWPEVGWGLARVKNATYYRISTFLASSAKRECHEPLTQQEKATHRPDLPMRLLRNAEADWNGSPASLATSATDIKIDAPELALIPFGAKGGGLKSQIVEAADRRAFRGTELLLRAQALQKAICPEVKGIGLYRSGISRGIPSYYLWGAVDQAGHTH